MVAGHWATAEEALWSLQGNDFDIALIDKGLPGMNGIEAMKELRKRNGDARFIIISACCKEEDVMEALSAGANGYLPKDTGLSELIDSIGLVRRGETVLGGKIARSVMNYARAMKDRPSKALRLTDEQAGILLLAAQGCANKEIADRTGLSIDTVKLRLKETFRRLDARDRTHAVVKAVQHGLITLE
jgi:DNA-binding NarL/FixJ family response regulator